MTETILRYPDIEALLRRFPADRRCVHFMFDALADGYVVRAVLQTPAGTMTAETDSTRADPAAAVDEVVRKLAAKLDQP